MCLKRFRRNIAEVDDSTFKSTQQSLQAGVLKDNDKSQQTVEDIAYRIQQGDATNIALTGPYGSGKTTVLLTLKNRFPQYNYLNISLATLKANVVVSEQDIKEKQKPKSSDILEEKDNNNLNRLIEYSILQQLVYREKQSTLPNSRLKRIFQLTDKEISTYSCCAILFVVAIIILFEPSWLSIDWLCDKLSYKWLNISADIISILYLLWFTYQVLCRFIQSFSNSKLNKLNLKSGEIEVVENTSIFNKHLDEILYFFQQTKYNVVILEDLDRFNTIDIFLKLRELNILLNESAVVGRKIFFIYAVRDDMFKDSERSKCFDYITTVIPIINRSNAKNVLKQELADRECTEIPDKVLKEMGFFINDMRLLKNIANEYVQYRNKISHGVKPENLLAMIIYKNYFPSDFAELHDCKGRVYDLLQFKDKIFQKKLNDIHIQKKEIEAEKLKYEQHRHLNEKEIRILYVNAYRNHLPVGTKFIYIDNQQHTFAEIAESETYFNKLISQEKVKYVFENYYHSNRTDEVTMLFRTIEADVDVNNSYHDKLRLLQLNYNTFVQRLELYEVEQEEIRYQTISQLMNEVDYREIPGYHDLEIPPMIEYLVSNGYINENYYDYISYFYDNMITPHDWNFLLDLKNKKHHPYDYHIDRVDTCFSEIPNVTFRHKSILNFEILDYLAELSYKNKLMMAKFNIVIKTAISEDAYDFFSGYYVKGRYRDFVFTKLVELDSDLWGHLDKDDCYLMLIWIKYAEYNYGNEESYEWMSEHYDFLTDHVDEISEGRLMELIKKYHYKFNVINERLANLFPIVIDSYAYRLTQNNVLLVVNYLLKRDNPEDSSLSFTIIKSCDNEPLQSYISANMAYALTNVFTEPSSKSESCDAIIELLNMDKVNDEVRVKYLRGQHNSVNVSDITSKETKIIAFKSEVVAPIWKNIVEYIKENENTVPIALKTYVESKIEILMKMPLPAEKEDQRLLLNCFIGSNILNFSTFTKVLEKFDTWYYNEFSNENYEENRMKELLLRNMLKYSDKNIGFINSQYSTSTFVLFLESNKVNFLNNSELVQLNEEIIEGLLNSPKFKGDEKIKVIQLLAEPDITKSIANKIIHLLQQYQIELDSGVLLKSLNLSDELNSKLFVITYTIESQRLDFEFISELFSTLPAPYDKLCELGKNPLLEKNNVNERLVRILEKIGYISSSSPEKNGIRVHMRKK